MRKIAKFCKRKCPVFVKFSTDGSYPSQQSKSVMGLFIQKLDNVYACGFACRLGYFHDFQRRYLQSYNDNSTVLFSETHRAVHSE